ncbi:MAG TPA: GerMN domain-containing protein [Ruminiclostridium sp.]
MRKILSFILVCGIMMTIFTGCTLLDKFGAGSANNDELTPASSVTMGEDEANGLKDKTPVQLYFINEQENKLSQETRYIKNTEASKGSEYLATAVLKELINGPAKGSLLQATIPKGTTVHSAVTIKDGAATVDLSNEFISNHPGGKKNEQLTLYSIVNTLTEIKDIKSVQFRINGVVKKEFKGSYQIDGAYPRSAYLISAQPLEDSSNKAKVQPSKEDVKEPVKEDVKAPVKEDVKEPVKEDVKAPAKEDIKEPVKKDTSEDQKTNSNADLEILE